MELTVNRSLALTCRTNRSVCGPSNLPRAAALRLARPHHTPRPSTLLQAVPEAQTSEESTAADVAENGTTPTPASADAQQAQPEIQYVAPSSLQQAIASFRLAFALPWRRFKSGSALTIKLSGAIAEQPQPRFSQTTSLPAICDSLRKAAYDPRIVGLVVKIDPVSCGWGKLQEIRRHVELFKQSGKWAIAYMERAGEKEYYLASAFDEIYAPPSASLSLRGLAVTGTFLRGVLDKVGVEPEVKRIGKFKSAGDQLLRKDMSEAQREQLTALLDDIYDDFVSTVASARGKTREEVEALLEAGVYDMEQFKSGGWVTDLKYEDELNDLVKARTGGKEDELRAVGLKKYAKVGRSAFGIDGGKVIAVVRTSGAIIGGTGTGSNITAGAVIAQLRQLKKNKKIAAVVLRVDSPGGDALASDLMWREIRKLAEEKPVIASMADVAASGGYYLSMACNKVVAETLTITGSIGVVTGKFNLAEAYNRIGYNKEIISRGRYAELLAENKPFTPDEAALFDAGAEYAYSQFRDKAALSRGMAVDAMEEVAQGRVWSGKGAASKGLVDALGGLWRAVALAKEAAGLKPEDKVTLLEVSRASVSPLALLAGGGATAGLPGMAMLGLLLQSVFGGNSMGGVSPAAAVGAPVLFDALLTAAAVGGGPLAGVGGSLEEALMLRGLSSGAVMAQLPGLEVDGVASQALRSSGLDASWSELFADC